LQGGVGSPGGIVIEFGLQMEEELDSATGILF